MTNVTFYEGGFTSGFPAIVFMTKVSLNFLSCQRALLFAPVSHRCRILISVHTASKTLLFNDVVLNIAFEIPKDSESTSYRVEPSLMYIKTSG